jgi:MEDS: MEthanogen/methylotroph, DcmR Sensory domain/Histidine kinase-like ATPase domain
VALTTDRVPAPHDHVVQFYGHDGELTAAVVPYLAGALDASGPAIVIATPAHRRAIATGLGPGAAGVSWLDADEAMAGLLLDGHVAGPRFDKLIGDVVREAAATAAGRPVRAYGEIVARMWAAGYVTAALELEDRWNDLALEVGFSLYCAYPLAAMETAGDAEALRAVCGQHSAVVGRPVELPPLRPIPLAVARSFVPASATPTGARRFVTGTLAAWGRPDLVDDAAVVVTELATNAVIHARTDLTVTVDRASDGRIRISVRDGSRVVPRPRCARALDGSGRGLGLVAAMVNGWGADVLPDGKVVWADFAG